MIDKLEIRIPRKAPFTREFSGLYQELRASENDPFRGSQHYTAVADLRAYGYDAIVHTFGKHGEGDHKLELLDTGSRSYAGMVDEVSRIFDVNPEGRDVMRVDLAADVDGVPVSWFQGKARAQYKRFACEIGKVEVVSMGSKGVETLYIGKRPNCFRIYDKVAEYQAQYARLLRCVSPDAELPDFGATYGVERTQVLTRVERQMGAGRVPGALGIVAQLKRAAEFNPFSPLKFHAGSGKEPSPYDHSLLRYCAGMYLRQRAQTEGAHQLRRWCSKFTDQPGRFMDAFAEFMPSEGEGVTPARLYEIYRASITRQIAA